MILLDKYYICLILAQDMCSGKKIVWKLNNTPERKKEICIFSFRREIIMKVFCILICIIKAVTEVYVSLDLPNFQKLLKRQKGSAVMLDAETKRSPLNSCKYFNCGVIYYYK